VEEMPEEGLRKLTTKYPPGLISGIEFGQ